MTTTPSPRPRHWLLLAFATVLAFASTAAPARAEPSSATVDLAKKLNGGEMRFRAYRDDNKASVLSFLTVKMKNCTAKMGSPELSNDPTFTQDYVECDVDLGSGPVTGTVQARVVGDKRNFTINLDKEEANKYALEAKLAISYADGNWHGKGNVDGWVNQSLGADGNLTATIHENVDF